MLVRDRTIPKTEYKGRPTSANDALCPCRRCWNAHDCGHYEPFYGSDGTHLTDRWVVRMACATRKNKGCPHPKPEPEHVYERKGRRYKWCLRCGATPRPEGEPDETPA